ncbi:phosphosugar-binding protein [Enterococcus haemoperoxidus ATCC BAA-382]|uniref:Phosphosugar-binding protein n=1 Tax=Enterococcus haemoperoxidus ATCC BAA-382 TaxID=1158608 RepID=R2SXD2_9ENTE|nr:SIS domain-containing protein [Enterococcus haemoperoxidus]EOH99900.1 phosphosugar-binding protein [Enterococcus haemoperoxidus ATCC BAA-382]EOT63014.1 phosphosugar-binding protein [Enterococcus haemoperoxidus ATCC BAA-382]OJG54628.1 phosphosugar-binding protein [Enterococcus haemoperoxidus]
METMLDYINEEQETLETIINSFDITQIKVKNVKHCLILATGSSYNACLSAKYYIEQTAPVYVQIEEPFNFLHYGKIDPSIDLIIAVSQSGKSASTIQAVQKLTQTRKIKTIALTSNTSSPISQVVDEVLDLNMGIETVGFVTKGYLATVLNLMLLGLRIAYQSESIDQSTVKNELLALKKAISQINLVIEKTSEFWLENQADLSKGVRFITIGYGPNIGTAKEFETKFTETVRLPSQGFELEAYMHGPYLEANNTHSLFFIENDNVLNDRSKALKNYLRNDVGNCYTITTEAKTDSKTVGLSIKTPEKISPLLLVIPFQYLAYQIATGKGIDLNKRIFDDFDQVLKSKI